MFVQKIYIKTSYEKSRYKAAFYDTFEVILVYFGVSKRGVKTSNTTLKHRKKK